jgi:hypothetical protein
VACERGSQKVGRTAGVKAGLSTLSSKLGHTGGRLVQQFERGLGRSATAVLRVSNSLEGPQTLEAILPVAAVGALFSRDGNKTRLRILNTIGTAQVARAATTALGTGLGRLSRPTEGPVRQEFYFKGKPPVRVWPSRLTPALNAGDVQGWRLAVQASEGQLYETEGKTWHYGTTRVKTSQGERTLTHLRSLALPATHYYFDRPLGEQEVAGIISGQKGFEARHLPGFAGQISELESLQPVVARMKKSLIRAHLLWGMIPQP